MDKKMPARVSVGLLQRMLSGSRSPFTTNKQKVFKVLSIERGA